MGLLILLLTLGCILVLLLCCYPVFYWGYHWCRMRVFLWQSRQEQLDFSAANTAYHTPHTPLYLLSTVGQIAPLIASLPQYTQLTLYDIGYGKGNIFYECRHLGLAQYAGIECDPSLRAQCVDNCNRLQLPVTLHQGYIQHCGPLDLAPYHIFYCYGVLNNADVTPFCRNLIHSYWLNPRPLYLLYRHPPSLALFTAAGLALRSDHRFGSFGDYHVQCFTYPAN